MSLSSLPSTVFKLVCSFLDLDTKCPRLPVLSRSFCPDASNVLTLSQHGIVPIFTLESCLAQSVLQLEIAVHRRRGKSQRRKPVTADMLMTNTFMGRARYTRYTCSSVIEIKVANSELLDQTMRTTTKQAIDNIFDGGHLRSLWVAECSDRVADTWLAPHVLTKLGNGPSKSLERIISLSIFVSATSSDFWLEHGSALATGISKCCSLQSLTLSPMLSASTLPHVLGALPSSLTDLQLMVDSFEDTAEIFNTQFRKTSFLPNLKRLSGVDVGMLYDGLCTIIQDTMVARPIECMVFSGSETLSSYDLSRLRHFSQLRELNVVISSIQLAALAECLACISSLTILQLTLEHEGGLRESDLTSLFNSLSQSLLTFVWLDFGCCPCALTSLSDSAMKSWTSIRTLNNFSVRFRPCIRDHGANNRLNDPMRVCDLTAGCLSDLKELAIYDWIHTRAQAASLVRAAPKLTSLSVSYSTSYPFSWIDLLPVIASSCLSLKKLSLQTTMHCVQHVQLTALQTAFRLYPLTSHSFQALEALHLNQIHLDLATQHFLFSHLSRLPCLKSIRFHANVNLLSIVLASKLPHLETFLQNTTQQVKNLREIYNLNPSIYKVTTSYGCHDWLGDIDILIAMLSLDERERLLQWDSGVLCAQPTNTC